MPKSLSPTQLTDFVTRYDAILEVVLHTCPVLEPIDPPPKKRRKPKQHPVKNLLDHLQVRKTETLAFIYDFIGAEVFYRIRTYISTARKNEHMCWMGCKWL